MRRSPILLCAGLLAFASPALADHVGPASVDGNGGGMDVVGPGTMERSKLAVGVRLMYLRPEQRSDEALEDLAGQDIHAHNSDYFLASVFDATWGASDRLTLSAQLPFIRRDGLREGEHHEGDAHGEVAILGNVSGIGDASLLAKFRLADAGAGGLALLAGVKAPTGATHERSLEGERLETEHQPGTGSWDFYAGAAAGTQVGPLQLDASLLYQFSGKGAQDTRLGDRLQAGIALSHRFGPGRDHGEAGEGGHHAEPHGHTSWDAFLEFTAQWEGRQRVAGIIETESGGTALWLQPGLRFNSAGGLSLGAAVGLPIWQDIRKTHPDDKVRVIFTIAKSL